MIITAISITERARRYIAKMPKAISGQHGHSTMFSVACVLTQGFDLNMGDARMLLEEYNATLTEPFSQRELEHKLQGAATRESAKGKGYLLNSSDKPIRVRITPKKPANTPPQIIYKIALGTGSSYSATKKNTLINHGITAGESNTPVPPVPRMVNAEKSPTGEVEMGVPPVPKAQGSEEDALPTISTTGVLRIPFNAPIRYRYWLRGTSFEQSTGSILNLKQIRECILSKGKAA